MTRVSPLQALTAAAVTALTGERWAITEPGARLHREVPATMVRCSSARGSSLTHVRTALLHGRGLRGEPQAHGVFADNGHLYIGGSVETTGLLNVLRIDDDGGWSETAVGLG